MRPKKTLGILGGMGPAAGAEFLRLLAKDAPAKCDQEHPRIVMLSEPTIPDRTDAIQGTGVDPTAQLRSGLERLIDWEVDLLAVPCNTAHYFIDSFRETLSVPFVHIVEETLRVAMRDCPNGAWLLSTSGTRQSGLYSEYAHRLGYSFFDPSDEQQALLQSTVSLVKAGELSRAGCVLHQVVTELWAQKNVMIVTACTELPLAYIASGLPKDKEISSLQALCDGCLEVLYGCGDK